MSSKSPMKKFWAPKFPNYQFEASDYPWVTFNQNRTLASCSLGTTTLISNPFRTDKCSVTFRILTLGHFDFRVGISKKWDIKELGKCEDTWALTMKGTQLHDEWVQKTFKLRLGVGDTIWMHLDRTESQVEMIINGKKHGIIFSSPMLKTGVLYPSVTISQGSEIKLV